MLLMKIRITEPAAVSPINSGGERRATSAICTPFQPDTAMPATAASSNKPHSGQAERQAEQDGRDAPSQRASASVIVLDTTWSAIHPKNAAEHAGRLHHREHQAGGGERHGRARRQDRSPRRSPRRPAESPTTRRPRTPARGGCRATASAAAPAMSVSRKLTSRCCDPCSRGGSMRDWNGQVSSVAAMQTAATTTAASRQPIASISGGMARPPSTPPSGTPACLIENTRLRCAGGVKRCQHLAAGRIGGAVGQADAGAGEQRQRDATGRGNSNRRGGADQQAPLQRAHAAHAAHHADAGGEHEQRADDVGGGEIADPALVPAELRHERRAGDRHQPAETSPTRSAERE